MLLRASGVAEFTCARPSFPPSASPLASEVTPKAQLPVRSLGVQACLVSLLVACGNTSGGAASASAAAPAATSASAGSSTPSHAAKLQPFVPPRTFKPLLLVDPGKLPSTTLEIKRERDVPIASAELQALFQAFHVCGGPPIAMYLDWLDNFYAPEILADSLADREHLRRLIECGAAALRENGWDAHVVTLSTGSEHRAVHLLSPNMALPDPLPKPATLPPGLVDARCLESGADCGNFALTMARVPSLGVVAVGTLGDLTRLADREGPKLAEPTAARIRAIGRDIDGDHLATASLAEAGDGWCLGAAEDFSQETRKKRDSLLKALRTTNAMLGCARDYDDLGKATLLVEVPELAHARAVRDALEAYRAALAARTSAPMPERRDSRKAAIARAAQRGLADAAVRQDGKSLSLVVNIVASAEERAQMDSYNTQRKEQLDSLGRVVSALLANEEPAKFDLNRIGGERFQRAFAERASRPPRDVQGDEIDLGGTVVLIPKGAKIESHLRSTVLVYDSDAERLVDDYLALLRKQGFTVRVMPVGSAPLVEAKRSNLRLTSQGSRLQDGKLRFHVDSKVLQP